MGGEMSMKEPVGFGAALFTVMGFVVIGFLSIQLHESGIWLSRTPRLYTVTAAFDNVGALKVDAPVKLAGVKVGQVTAISLEASRKYKAIVVLVLDERYGTIPLDSIAAIQTASLLGGNFIAINPGGAVTSLRDGSEILAANSAFSIEHLIGSVECVQRSVHCVR
jgi:phospholipid/cholesterol/gamma-HCH transport system substrate-binding protein